MDVDLCGQPNNAKSLKQTISDLDAQLTHRPTRISPLQSQHLCQNEIPTERNPVRTKSSVPIYRDGLAFRSGGISV